MTKALMTAVLAAFLIAPFGLSAGVQVAAAAEVPQAAPADPAGSPSPCDSITNPVKKKECMKQESASPHK